MKQFWNISAALVVAIFLLVISCTFVSCKSKKKILEKEKLEVFINENKSTTENQKTTTTVKDTNSLKIETVKITSNQKLELTQADPEKVIIIEDETGKKLKITGANAIVSNTNKIEEATIQKDTSTNTTQITDTKKTEDTKTKIKLKEEKKNLDLKTSGLPTWVWIVLIIIILLIIIYFVARKYLKTQIPFL